MDHPFSNDVLDKIMDYFDDNDDFPSENMDDDGWDDILQEQFNTIEEHYNYSDYMRDYPTMLEIIHTYAEDSGFEPEYWNFQKMINLYMYIVAKEIITDRKDVIIERWQEENESDSSDSSDDEPDPFTNELLIPIILTQ
jgi:hypothetical protein